METLDFKVAGCVLHKTHVPAPQESHMHHVFPLYMQDEVGHEPKDGPKIAACPTGHYNIHHRIGILLNGGKIRGRPGKTGYYASEAVAWYKEKKRIAAKVKPADFATHMEQTAPTSVDSTSDTGV